MKEDTGMSTINEVMAQIVEGMDVFSSDGQKLGEVGAVNIGTRPSQMVTSESTTEERSFFQVRSGFLGLGEDLWVPGAAIQQVDDTQVILRYTREEANLQGWASRPTTPEPGADYDGGLFGLQVK